PGFLYVTGMTVDADGSPRAYNPSNTGLDNNQNAMHGDQWVGVVTEHGRPVIQKDTDPAPGFYVSPTTLEDTTKKLIDPLRYVDSERIPYLALPPEVLHPDGARMGDLAVVMNLSNNALSFAIVADRGPSGHIGAGSIALAKALGIASSPRVGGASNGV